jgi:tRNA(fMet)-specific endonuclease VapC
MDAALLDTDIFSEVLKQQNAHVVQQAAQYLHEHGQFTLSVFTRFEIIRGYKEKRADKQLAKFNTFCQHSKILPVTEAIFERAADLWVTARHSGQPHGDADILIAASALEYDLMLITGNSSHFAWIKDLDLRDWRQV